MNEITEYYNQISAYSLLTPEKELMLAKMKDDGDDAAFNALVCANLRLVVKIAKEYQKDEHLLMDTIQDGNEGLISAIQKYDWTKGAKVSTYASWYIKQRIITALYKNISMVSMPENIARELAEVKRKIDETDNYKIEPLDEMEDIASEGFEDDIISEVYNQQLRSQINTLLEQFSEEERTVAEYTFGLNEKDVLSDSEISKETGIPIRKVKSYKEKVVRKLKSPANKAMLQNWVL